MSWLYSAILGSGGQPPPPPPHPTPSDPPPSYTDTPPPRPPTSRPPLNLPTLTHLRHKRIILASASPRRAHLLSTLGFQNLTIRPSNHPEDLPKHSFTPFEYVLATASQKCAAVYAREIDVSDPALVVAADTVIVTAAGDLLEKPRSEAEHVAMLMGLRDGPPHKVYTAVVVMAPLESGVRPGYARRSHVEETVVTFDEMVTDELVRAYVATREGADKAGGYAIQGTGAVLIKRIEGSYDNVVGLPLRGTLKIIEKVMNHDDMEEDQDCGED